MNLLRVFLLNLLVIVCNVNMIMETDGIVLGKEEEDLLTKIVEEFHLNPTHWIYNSPFNPGNGLMTKIFLWCPLQHYEITLLCPSHKCPLVFHAWTTQLTHQSPRNPRLVYDLNGNIILVQSIYRCPYHLADHTSSGHEFYSASTDILECIPQALKDKFPVKIFYRTACSKDLLDYVVTHIGRGQNFLELAEDIASMNFRAFVRNSKGSIDSNSFYENVLYSFPSNDQLMHMFLSFFNDMETGYQKQMEAIPCSILSCDHTFKVSKQIGVVRGLDNAFVNQFENLYIALNENGQVVAWRLTRSTAFKEVEDILKDLKACLGARNEQLHMIMVDDCCSVRPSYNRVFPGVAVKLDLFHACQRFVKTIPKGSCQSQQLSSEFGLVFRASGDEGPTRKKETPDPECIESNLQMFIEKWDYCLKEENKKAIANIQKHIRSGCCSGIPPGSGTQKNERLHKQLKRSLLGGACTISPELAIAVLTVVLYVWNCKMNPDAKKHRSNARIIPVVPLSGSRQNLIPAFLPKKFKSADTSKQVPLVMAAADNQEQLRCSLNTCRMGMDINSMNANYNTVEDLKNDSFVSIILDRVLHLNEILSSVEKKCMSRAFDIFNFPFSDIKRMVQIIHGQTSRAVQEDQSFVDNGISVEMNRECLQRHLLAFGLQVDQVPGDGNCCFTSIITAIHSVLVNSSDHGNEILVNYLQSNGLLKSIESDTARLRHLFCHEIETNIDKYSSFVDFNVKDELKKFSESGWFNSSLGDLCVFGCGNLLRIPIVVITSLPNSPVLTFMPSTLLSTCSIYIAYDHSFQGHYDATKAVDDINTTDRGSESPIKKKICICGLLLQQKGAHVLASCNSSRCSCAKAGQKCSRECRCINCQNSSPVEMKTSGHLVKGCTCGLTKKRDLHFVACKDSYRKSKCPCLRKGLYCSDLCKCVCCGNRTENQKSLTSSTAVGKPRKRSNPNQFKRTKGASFLAERGFDVAPGPWTSLETLTLLVIIELLTPCSTIQMTSKNVCDLYNFIASSSMVKSISLPIAYKAFSKVVSKLAFINSKHAVFESLLDSNVEKS